MNHLSISMVCFSSSELLVTMTAKALLCQINPTALRKAKIVDIFSLLSAIGLMQVLSYNVFSFNNTIDSAHETA